jgi:GntR family transcriptional regulator
MIIKIDPSNGVPIFLQIVQQVKYKIASGILRAGEQLPSVRQMAGSLRVNPNTVARAYTELERDKVVFTKRGMGCFVSDEGVVIHKEEKERIIAALIDNCLSEAFHLDVPWDEVEHMFQERLKRMTERENQ